MTRACIFAHFDKHDRVDEYVYYYLNELLTITDKIVLVTVSDILVEDVQRLKSLNIEVIKRENQGYDFYSYKVGIKSLDLERFDELIICNDSIYGPFVSLAEVFSKMENKECDFWGITASKSIAYHLQSYFFVYRNNILKSAEFLDFWNNVVILDDKSDIVREYEVGLSLFLFEKGFTSRAYVENVNYEVSKKDNSFRLFKRLLKAPYKIFRVLTSPYQYWSAIKRKNTNTSLVYWDQLLLNKKMPFLKVSLFTNNQDSKENLNKFEEIIKSISNYPTSLIKKHLKRIL
ncbi:MAG TPA: hypothetical protein EYH57_00480 [Sulfurovum sp.]|nr:hypothetical protein [Hydrogenothermaceae bacterium]HIQ46073.1 hypothetical protein [Sulfurovum sp.]